MGHEALSAADRADFEAHIACAQNHDARGEWKYVLEHTESVLDRYPLMSLSRPGSDPRLSETVDGKLLAEARRLHIKALSKLRDGN